MFGKERSRIAYSSYNNPFLYGTADNRHDLIRFFFVKPTETSNQHQMRHNHRASYQKNSRAKYGNHCMSAQRPTWELRLCSCIGDSLSYSARHKQWPMTRTQVHGRHNCLTTDIIPRSSYLFSFYGLTFTFCHLFCKSLFAMFLDVTDAGGTVGMEKKSEHLAYPIGKQLAFLYVVLAFSASI